VYIAQVVGQVVSTAKDPGLRSHSLLIVRDVAPQDPEGSATDGAAAVAVDLVGAGMGELVLIATGRAARMPRATESAPTDLAVVGIVDSVTHHESVTYRKS
jgi:ethanolamine utilization protein EutN